jgi:protein-L-isoaspartate(D-aspartate) O-methyltransferase
VKFGDGYFGWPEHAPFDAIIVTAAADHVPPPLIQQLKNGGRMAVPLGNPFGPQWLVLVEKDDQGTISTRNIAAVAFVPLTRQPNSE